MSSLLGTTLGGRYRLESRIGSGGMSTVYRAHDETLERFVAVKLMNREVSGDSDQLERFRREARAVARLSHPNIVQVIDAGEDDGRPYIVFEHIDGETLKERIRRLGRLEVDEAVVHAIGIARALAAAHASHVVHRDVKPQNVLIERDGTARVTDFGIARTLEEDGLTADGRVLGTTDYVAPEQALGQRATGQSDLYSLGVVLYEMLTGVLPYRGESQVAVAMAHVRETVPDVRVLRREAPAGLAAVVQRATAKDLGERYADEAAMIADLERVRRDPSAPADEPDGQVTAELDAVIPGRRSRRGPRLTPQARRHRTLTGALVAMLVALGVAAAVVLRSHARSGGGHAGAQVRVALTHASAYNPFGLGGNTYQENGEAPNAIDGKPKTAWYTQEYFTHSLDKPGVGIYVWGAAAVAATKLVLHTATPGFDATVEATNSTPQATSFASSHWTPVGSVRSAAGTQPFTLDTHGRRYRYYLLWITSLPVRTDYVAVNEIDLYR